VVFCMTHQAYRHWLGNVLRAYINVWNVYMCSECFCVFFMKKGEKIACFCTFCMKQGERKKTLCGDYVCPSTTYKQQWLNHLPHFDELHI